MQAISTSPFNLSVLRKANVWYSVKDGNWTDPNVWISNGRRKFSFPQPTDDVVINAGHTVFVNPGFTTAINNVYVFGTLGFSNSTNQILSVKGNLYSPGTIDMTNSNINILKLYGVLNYIQNFPTPGIQCGIEYASDCDQEILDISYRNLTFSGNGKRFISNSLTINGITSLNGGPAQIILNRYLENKLTFIGKLICNASQSTLDNTINAEIELRSGIEWDDRFTKLLLGNGNLILNGTQTINAGGALPYNNYNTIIIKPFSTVTLAGNSPFIVNGSLDGENSTSVFNVAGVLYQATTTEPMSSNGVYNYNYATTSTVGYVMNGSYTLPYGSYKNLYITGSGTKSLGQNTIVDGSFTNQNSGSLALLNYSFSVVGPAYLGGALIKNHSAGLLQFKGAVAANSNSSIQLNTTGIVAEFQNGLTFDVRTLTLTTVPGVTLKFTTRNQNLDIGGDNTLVISADILISGAINVTSVNQGFTASGIINGDSELSTFTNLKLLRIRNSQKPMTTGLLVSSAIGSNLIYDFNDNQDLSGGNIYNLTLAGAGTKKLLGDITVINNYLLVSPAILDLNSYQLNTP